MKHLATGTNVQQHLMEVTSGFQSLKATLERARIPALPSLQNKLREVAVLEQYSLTTQGDQFIVANDAEMMTKLLFF